MSDWVFREDDNRLYSGESSGEDSIQLTPKASAVLACLLRRSGQTVTREDILAEVWPGLNVTKDLVREYIFDLRAALGDDARNPKFIETVRGRGFRLIGPIVAAHDPTDADNSRDGRTVSIRDVRPTVAVLRPDTRGGGSEWADFAFDLADGIITRLAHFHDIGVVSRNSSFAIETTGDLRTAAHRLGANYLLESSVVVLDDAVRTRFQLVGGETGLGLWAQSFKDQRSAMSNLSEKLAVGVVNALSGWHGELHRAEYKAIALKDPDTMNAFEHFIAGAALDLEFEETSLKRNIAHLDRSLALDPTFARCWLVRSLMQQWAFDASNMRDPSLLKASAASLEEAFLRDPGDPSIAALMAFQRCRGRDLHGALQLLDRADASCEADADASICVALGKSVLSGDNVRAVALFDTAHALNPTPPKFYPLLETWVSFFAGDDARCIQLSRSAPQQVSILLFRALSHAMLGQTGASRQTYEEICAIIPALDFERFAAHFPIAHANPLKRYRHAVAKLQRAFG